MKRLRLFIIFTVCFIASAFGTHLLEAQASSQLDISITNEGYFPQVTLIPVGTAVTWTNLEGVHTTTSRDGLWDSGVLVEDETFNYVFNEIGLYPYYDTIHRWPSGLIQVVHSMAQIEIYTDKSTYNSGDVLKVGVDLTNPGSEVQVGVYIWVNDPGGGKRWLENIPSVLLPEGFSHSNDEWFTIMLPPLPRGEYTLNARLVKVSEQDLISSDSASLTFGSASQSDWSGGPVSPGPSALWDQSFDTSTGVAWRSIESQLSLTAQPRGSPQSNVIAYDAGIPKGVATGDLNGDGKDDVVTADPIYDLYEDLGAIYWWERLENGTWVQDTVSGDFYGAWYVGATDVDLDGDLDVIASAYYGDGPELGRNGKYAWFENLNGDASSWEKHLVGDDFWGASHIDAGDLDGDGDIDLVGASQLTDGIDEQESDMTWFENLDGKGHIWGQHDLDLDFPNASEAHIADLDGDGDLDIVGAYSHPTSTSTFAWWENANGDGSVWTKHWIPFDFWGSGYLSVGDIDNDGDIDLIGSGYNSSQVGFWENLDGSGTSWTAWYAATMPSGRGIDLKDIDGDGDLDAVAWNSYWVSWIENVNGSGYLWDQRYLGFDWDLPWAAAGDIDDNGKLDIVVTSEETDWPPPGDDQVLWFDVSKFGSSGELTSTILDGDTDPSWRIMTWHADVPSGADFSVEVRASNDETDLGTYVVVPSSGTDLGDIIDPNARYLQYRVSLSSSDPAVSPVLHDIGVETGEGTK
jgi:plastocyanin